MSRSLVVSSTAIGVAAAAAAGGWWLHANHKLPALTALEIPAGPTTGSNPTATASREPSPAPSPPKPSMRAEPGRDAPAAQNKDQPSFDVVRVEPKGDTVVAGKGAPNSKVELMAGGRKVGEAVSDAAGQFVILPPPLPPGDYALTLRQDAAGKPTDSKQSVAVSVPQQGKGAPVVALAEPGKATKLLSKPPAAGAPMPAGKVAIVSAELENGTGFYVTGTAQAGAQVHVYLNGAHIAEVVAGPDGGWSVRVKQGLTGGHYVVRADVGEAGGRVASRAEVPFDVPVAMAAAPKPPAAAIKPPAAAIRPPAPAAVASDAPPPSVATAPAVAGATSTTAAAAVVETIATARVTTGDNLWNISRFRLGDGKRYTQIYAANAGQIRNPNLIYPGQVFVVPKR